jgi:hypothetical protein
MANNGIFYTSGNTLDFTTTGVTWARLSSGGTFSSLSLSSSTLTVTDYANFGTNPTVPSPTGGTLFYDSTNNALAYKPITNNNDVTIQIGQESVIRIYNDTGIQINNGQALFITGGTSGASTVTLAIATGGSNMYYQVDGVATHDIPNGEFGFMSAFGEVRDLNLSAFTLGEDIFLSETTPGAFSSFSALTYTGRTSQIGYVTITGSSGTLQLNINNEPVVGLLTATENNVLAGGNASTGTYSFTGISIATSTTINIAPVNGWIAFNTGPQSIDPSILSIVYPGQTGVTLTNLSTADATYILLTSAVTITQQTTFPTPQERRQNIFLGKVVHPNRTSILAVNNTVDYSLSVMSSLRDLWSPIKLINDGILPSPSGTGLSFLTSAGTLWGNGINWTSNQLNPNSVSISAKSPASFFYRTQTGGTSGSVSVIDPTKYDLNGVITSVGSAGSNDATNQRIYIYPTGVINVLYGQHIYPNLADAIAAVSTESFTVFPNAATTGILIGILSVRNDIVDDGQNLSNINYAKFTLVSKFGEAFGGTGGISTTTLQQAYDNSTEPEILINAILDGLSIQNGTGNPDNATQLLQGKNTAADVTSFIRADGLISGSTLSTPGFTANTNGLTATTISATTYQNLPFSGTVRNSGTTTSNFIPRWTGTTALTNSQIQDDGTNISIGQSPVSPYRFFINDQNTGTTNSFVVNGGSATSKTAIRGASNATQYGTGVYGSASSSVESIGLDGLTLNGTLAIGVRGVATPDEFTNITTGIGGYFASDDSYGYGLPTNRYSVQLKDGTEGTNKVLVSTTSDGKANWSSSLTGLTSVSATTYYNLPISGVTDGSGISTSITNGNLTITATGGGGGGLTFQQVQMIAFLTS